MSAPNVITVEVHTVRTQRVLAQRLARNASRAKEEIISKLSADPAEEEDGKTVNAEDLEEPEDHTEGLTEAHTITEAVEEIIVAGTKDKEETIVVEE